MSTAKPPLLSAAALPTPGAVLAGPPNQPIAPAGGAGASSGGPARLRTRGRKKAAPPIEPDAIYRAEPVSAHAVTGAKRTAQDRPDAEPRKRKRTDHVATFHAQQGTIASSTSIGAPPTAHTHLNAKQQQNGVNVPGKPDGETQASFFEFTTLPTSALYSYIIHHSIVPDIYPTPLTADDPPPPAALLDPARMASRAPTPAPTPANRPRRARETKSANRRRSTRLLEEMRSGMEQVPVLADVGELHGVLAAIAQRHFRESSVREMDTLASFMSAVKARGGRWQ